MTNPAFEELKQTLIADQEQTHPFYCWGRGSYFDLWVE